MSTLDDFQGELETLLKKYDYVLSSVKEEIDVHNRPLISLASDFLSLVRGVQTIDLEIRAVRLRKK